MKEHENQGEAAACTDAREATPGSQERGRPWAGHGAGRGSCARDGTQWWNLGNQGREGHGGNQAGLWEKKGF